jgi:hypothetical protein
VRVEHPDIWPFVTGDAQATLGTPHDASAVQARSLALAPQAQRFFDGVVGDDGRHSFVSAWGIMKAENVDRQLQIG